MKLRKGIFFCSVIFMGAWHTLYAQAVPQQKSIPIIARPVDGKILLRWAPKDEIVWQLMNKYGVMLERYTVVRNGTLLSPPERIVLTKDPVKHLPPDSWRGLVEVSDYYAIAAQALFGESFEAGPSGSDIMEVINKSRENEMRYSFMLLAADHSFEVAKAAGMAFEDITVKPGERYLYRLYSYIPQTVIKTDTSFVYKSLLDQEDLPKPVDVKGEFTDRVVLLRWDKRYHEQIYTSYIVEKSKDNGRTFAPLGDLPFINTDREAAESPYLYRLDSLENNETNYIYRVKGITPFGEVGPPSDTLSGRGVPVFGYQPYITDTEVTHDNKVRIDWKVNDPGPGKGELMEFSLLRSREASGYFEVVKAGIPKEQRFLVDDTPGPTNYYVISAHSKMKQQLRSFPVLVQLEDSIPPVQPIGLAGAIDTTGLVTLKWRPNNEIDLHGYRVYRSEFRNSEYAQVTRTFVLDSVYVDTINIKALNKNVYYKITAVDTRFNESVFSTVMELKRPDIIPPVPPVFSEVRSTDKGISLRWKRSSSDDVVQQVLYRSERSANNWEQLQIFKNDTSAFIDTRLQPSTVYYYKLVAADESSNYSHASPIVNVRTTVERDRIPVDQVVALANRETKKITLNWRYPNWNNIEKFLIYRAEGNEPISVYRMVPSSLREFQDQQVSINTSYRYRIKVIYKDGSESVFSEESMIQF